MTAKSNKSKTRKSNKSVKASPPRTQSFTLSRPLTTTSTRSRCNPHIYLTSTDVLFQVSFNNPDNILFPNATKNSIFDCGYKALAALGLRNLQRSLMESNLVNRRGTAGINSMDMENYIRYIFYLQHPVQFIVHDLPIVGDYERIQNRFTTNLQLNHATIFLIHIVNKTDITDSFYHYLIAYNVRNTIYYYNPQTNLTSNLTEMYLSTNLRDLLNHIYPLYKLGDDYGYFNISDHGVPKPVIKNRLKTFLEFTGGNKTSKQHNKRYSIKTIRYKN